MPSIQLLFLLIPCLERDRITLYLFLLPLTSLPLEFILLCYRYSLLPETQESQIAEYQPTPKKASSTSISGDVDMEAAHQLVEAAHSTTANTTVTTNNYAVTNPPQNINNTSTNNSNININSTDAIQSLPPPLERVKLKYKRDRRLEMVTRNVVSQIACTSSNIGLLRRRGEAGR